MTTSRFSTSLGLPMYGTQSLVAEVIGADAYIEPIQWEVVRKIIEKERPDAVLPTMGGQTALNCALDLLLFLI